MALALALFIVFLALALRFKSLALTLALRVSPWLALASDCVLDSNTSIKCGRTLPYLFPYLTLPFTLPLPYLTFNLTVSFTLPYLYLTLPLTLPYLLPYLTSILSSQKVAAFWRELKMRAVHRLYS